MRTSNRRFILLGLSLPILTLAACASDHIVGVDGDPQAVVVTVGDELDITLGNPSSSLGQYAVPPKLTSSILVFIGELPVSPSTISGPSQRFRFQAQSTGSTVVTFQRMLGDSLVSSVVDTIIVHGKG